MEVNAFNQCAFFSINMPWDVSENSSRRLACVSDARFNRLFAKRSDGMYEHDMDLPDFLEPEDSSPYDGDCQLVPRRRSFFHDSIASKEALATAGSQRTRRILPAA